MRRPFLIGVAVTVALLAGCGSQQKITPKAFSNACANDISALGGSHDIGTVHGVAGQNCENQGIVLHQSIQIELQEKFNSDHDWHLIGLSPAGVKSGGGDLGETVSAACQHSDRRAWRLEIISNVVLYQSHRNVEYEQVRYYPDESTGRTLDCFNPTAI